MVTNQSNKLIRDKILGVMETEGYANIKTVELDGDDHVKALFSKLVEEAVEAYDAFYNGSTQDLILEFADLQEVVSTIYDKMSISADNVEGCRLAKLESKGGFGNGVFLISFDTEEQIGEE